jgi:RuvB-like protein 2
MITVADLVCKKRKGKEISVDDVKKVYGLFIDVERSVKFLKQYQTEFMFHEQDEKEDDEEEESKEAAAPMKTGAD